MINFHGYKIVLNKVVGVGPRKTIRSDKPHLSTELAFDLFMEGNTIEIVIPEPDEYIDPYCYTTRAENWRNELIDFLEINGL